MVEHRSRVASFRTAVMIVVGFALLGLTPTPAVAVEATPNSGGSPPPPSASYVLMIHSTFEPHSLQAVDDAESGNVQIDQAITGTTYASGAAGATRDGDSIVFHAIPYLAATVYPVVVRNPRLEVTQVGGDRKMLLEPNLPADQRRICHSETTWAGHEGPVEACSVYRVPVADFDGMNVVTLTLHFEDASGPREQIHSFPAHFLLHMAIEEAPIDLTVVDETFTEPTPLIIQNKVDMQGTGTSTSTSWRCAAAY
jgi:hypothetical protein